MKHRAIGLALAASIVPIGCSSDAPSSDGERGGAAPFAGGAATGSGGSSASGGSAPVGGVASTGGTAGSGGLAGSGGTSASGGREPSPEGGLSIRPIAPAPTYRGTVNNAGGCARDYATHGFEPDDTGAKHPLFLYFTGTNFVSDEASFRTQMTPAAEAVTKAMARRGMVALWVEYDNGALAWLSDHVAQLECLFGESNSQSILALACALPNVDCGLGIATWGHSQGGYIADAAHSHDPRVRAAWLTGYGGDAAATTPRDRVLLVNGENDPNGQVAKMNQIAGLTDAACPDDGRSECRRPNGSGWILVRARDCVNSTADHCWFDRKTCTDGAVTLEPNWIDPASTKPFALEANADWVAAMVAHR